MKITVENKEIINSKELHAHDGIMGPITYNYEDKSCIFEVMNQEWNKHQTFHVKGILYMEMQCCEFWGHSPHISSWYCHEPEKRTEELFRRKVTEYNNYYSLLDIKKGKYFEHVFEFISGNEIRFICEEIEFHEYPYYKDEED